MLVSIDGADKTGKTSQIDLLHKRNPEVVVVPPMMTFSNKWFLPDGRASYAHSIDWWACDAKTETNVIDAFLDAMINREAFKRQFNPDVIMVEDRSNQLLMWSLLSWLTLKKGKITETDQIRIHQIFMDHDLIPEKIDLPILLSNGSDVDQNVAITMGRIETDDPYFYSVYSQYQLIFQKYINDNCDDYVIVDAGDTLNGVHNKIINTIQKSSNNRVVLL